MGEPKIFISLENILTVPRSTLALRGEGAGVHLKYIEKGVYKAINNKLLEIYLKNNRCSLRGKGFSPFPERLKLKYQSIDSSFSPAGAGIANKGGIYKSKINDVKYDNQKILTKVPLKTLEEAADKHKIIQYNRYNGRKRYLKISAITSSSPQRGMPVKRAGAVLGIYILQAKSGDSGYDSKRNKNLLIKRGYTPIIKPNKRNNKKNKHKIKLTMKQQRIYKKPRSPLCGGESGERLVVEHNFAWVKNYPIINQIYEKTISSYDGLLQLVNSIVLSKKIIKDHISIKNKQLAS